MTPRERRINVEAAIIGGLTVFGLALLFADLAAPSAAAAGVFFAVVMLGTWEFRERRSDRSENASQSER